MCSTVMPEQLTADCYIRVHPKQNEEVNRSKVTVIKQRGIARSRCSNKRRDGRLSRSKGGTWTTSNSWDINRVRNSRTSKVSLFLSLSKLKSLKIVAKIVICTSGVHRNMPTIATCVGSNFGWRGGYWRNDLLSCLLCSDEPTSSRVLTLLLGNKTQRRDWSCDSITPKWLTCGML